MLNSPQEIQEFINWCKQNKVKTFKFKDLEFEISDLAFIEIDNQVDLNKSFLEQQESMDTLNVDNDTEFDDLLFHSAKP